MSENALRVLDKAILYGIACNGRKKKPGAVIESLTQQDRDALKELASDDTVNQRPSFPKVQP